MELVGGFPTALAGGFVGAAIGGNFTFVMVGFSSLAPSGQRPPEFLGPPVALVQTRHGASELGHAMWAQGACTGECCARAASSQAPVLRVPPGCRRDRKARVRIVAARTKVMTLAAIMGVDPIARP